MTVSNFNVYGQAGENLVCYNELITYVRTFFITGFLLNFLEILIPAIKNALLGRKFLIKRTYEWGEADQIIEKEWEKIPFQLTVEVDGVLSEYLEITLLLSFIAMFGQVFPLGFTFGFLILCSELFIDKYKLLNQIRRPTPKGASDIGSWEWVISFMSYMSIIVNVSVLTFTSGTTDMVLTRIFFPNIETSGEEYEEDKILIFTVALCFMLVTRKIIQGLVPDVPRSTK